MTYATMKLIPRLLTAQLMKHRLSAASDLLECAEADENFFKNIVSSDETLAYSYDPKTK
jgi:hypothetical protein